MKSQNRQSRSNRDTSLNARLGHGAIGPSAAGRARRPPPDSLAARVEPQVEWLSTDALKPWPRNARTHFKRQINLIARSIEWFGFMNPILIDEEFRIIAGHGRWARER
jgi:ParB-like nuclease domain